MTGSELHARPSLRVVNAVADAQGVPPADLDPLTGRIDLESLDDLLANSAAGVRVACLIDGFRVEVDSEGEVQVSRETTD
jgi:hypothetical protein